MMDFLDFVALEESYSSGGSSLLLRVYPVVDGRWLMYDEVQIVWKYEK
jgi:hypothetical protein